MGVIKESLGALPDTSEHRTSVVSEATVSRLFHSEITFDFIEGLLSAHFQFTCKF